MFPVKPKNKQKRHKNMMKEESTDLDLEAIHRRLNKIIGQCNGISRMIDRKAACADIILQVSAAKSALHRVGQLLLVNHLKECAREGVEKNDAELIIRREAKAVDYFCRLED